MSVATLMWSPGAGAAGINDVIDSFERPEDDPIDVEVGAGYRFEVRRGKILREFRCLAHDQAVVGQFCPTGSRIDDANELKVERRRHVLDLEIRLGVWRAAEFNFRLPIVLFDQTELTYASGVSALNSTVDPQGDVPPPSLFSMPFSGPERSGVGDPVFGVRLNPLSWARDRTRATWSLDMNVTVPLRKESGVKRADNTAVGEGLWVVDIGTALSARPIRQVEPYFRAGGSLRVPHSNSLFDDMGSTQTLVSPGHGMNATVGVELHAYEDFELERAFTIDIGGRLDYRFEGREYTELFEALGQSTCDARDPTEPCDLTTFDRGDIDPVTGRRAKTDGITDVEQYATLSSWVGLKYQAHKHFSVGFQVDLAYEMPHFLTFADAGKDLDGRNQVEKSNSAGVNEFNPVYNSAYDGLGKRFRSGGMTTVGVALSLSGKF